MARSTSHPPTATFAGAAALLLAVLAAPATAQDAGRPAAPAPAAKPPELTFTFEAPGKERAKLIVNPDDPGGPPATFKVVVGAAAQTFTAATPRAARIIDVPAGQQAFVRFKAEQDGKAMHALALLRPDSRSLLITDRCATWDVATSGGSATAACIARERHCPTAHHPSEDRSLTQNQCGGWGAIKFCVPDYQIDVLGEKGQKVRVAAEGGEPGSWFTLKGRGSPKRYRLPSGGRCPGVTVSSQAESVRLLLAWGQRVLVRISSTGEISAEHVPLGPAVEAAGGGD
jgi:hypothetical protein